MDLSLFGDMPRIKGSKTKNWPLIRYRTSTPYRPWMIDCGMIEGKRVRYAFRTKEEAEGKAALLRAQRRSEGEEAFSLGRFDRADVEAAIAVLKPHRFTLLEAAEFHVANASIIKEPHLVSAVVEELLETKGQDGCSKRYLADLRMKLANGFSAQFGTRAIHEITHRELDDWLRSHRDWSAVTRNNHAAALSVLFSFALRRSYLLTNPTKKLERANVTLEKPGILSLDECKALLRAADSDFVPAIAIGLFAGLRPEAELWPLDWRSIDFKERLIDISVSKNSASHRFVKISDNLAAWLERFKKDSGPLCPRGDTYYGRLEKARAAAARRLHQAGMLCPSLEDWPQDAMRHTFASMHYAAFKHAAETAEQMGHSRGLRVFFRHYRSRIKETDARAFWQLQPSSSFSNRPSRPARAN
jgi:integrase